MKNGLAIGSICITILLAGCTFMRAAPECSKTPNPVNLNPVEKSALKDASARYALRCKRRDYQCEISLVRNEKGEILVSVASVYPDRASGNCVQAPGDLDLAVYNTAGAFVRTVMAL